MVPHERGRNVVVQTMKNPCIQCGRHFPGLNWVIDDAAWIAIAGKLSAGELCPWCADERMQKAGVTARATLSISLPAFNAFNMRTFGELEALDSRVQAERLRT